MLSLYAVIRRYCTLIHVKVTLHVNLTSLAINKGQVCPCQYCLAGTASAYA